VRPALICLLAAFAATLASCSDTPTTPSSSAPYSQVDLLLGTGTEAAAGNTLTVNYTGWLFDSSKPDGKGLQFDSSVGHDPFQFILGAQRVIAGWDRGLVGMKVGGIRRLVIPPSLGYGDIRNNSIPAYSTLVFDIELIAVQ
jgi:FKBP-type peptidyl-prolyl cis-trans isomerase FkpA